MKNKVLLLIGLMAFPLQAYADACPSDFSSDAAMIDYVKSRADFKSSDQNIKSETVDIDLDGKPDRLIGFGCGNAGCNYNIFLQVNNGQFRYAGHAFFAKDGYRIFKNEDPKTIEMLSYWGMGVGAGSLVRYEITCSETKTIVTLQGQPSDVVKGPPANLWKFVGNPPGSDFDFGEGAPASNTQKENK